jgi:predicted flavoprotein YhiN
LYEYSHFRPKKWIQLHEKEYFILENILNETEVSVNGKNTFKEEFVTAGGVDLKYIHFKTMEYKNYENLYFAGEVLNIDAVTGGFNFQAAWTTGFIVAETILKRIADNQ